MSRRLPHLWRLLAAIGLAILPSAVLYAQNATTYEAVTFDDTARAFTATTITPLGRAQQVTCEGKLEDGQIRIRYDGTAPTDTEGTLIDVGNTIRIDGHAALLSFRGIRTGATSGIIRFHCTQEPALELAGTGGGSSGSGGGDGTLLDGANAAIKATVKDYTNANPLTVSVVDTNGDPASLGGGTQYTEDAAAAANPIGTMNIARRRDTLTAAEVSTDGDNIALNSTSKGELYVKQTDAVPATQSGTWTVQPGNTANSTAWLVTGAGGSFPSTQSGTWTVQPGNTANTTAWLVTGAGGTFPVTNAGTFVTQVNGAALTSLQLIDDAVSGTGFNISQVNGVTPLMGNGATGTGARRVSIASDSSGPVRMQDGAGNALTSLSVGSQRAITVSVVDGSGNQVTAFSGSGGTASNFGSAIPSSGTAVGFSDGTNMQLPRVVDLDTSGTAFWGLPTNLVKRTSGTPTELIGQALMAASLPVVLASDQSAVPIAGTVQPGNTANTTPWLFTPYQGGANLFSSAAALADNTSNPTIGGMQVFPMVWDPTGGNWDRFSPAVDGTHGVASIAGGPTIHGEATSSVSGDTNVADGQDTRLKAGLDGVLITRPYANAEDTLACTPVGITDGSSTAVCAAAGSGIRNNITTIECANTSTVDVTVDIRDGAAGAVLWTMSCPKSFNGSVREFPMPLRGTANTAIAADPSASVSGGTVTLSMAGFKAK